MGRLFKIPVVYEFRSLWMLQKSEGSNKFLLNRMIEKGLLALEIACLKSADYAIFLNEKLAERVYKKPSEKHPYLVVNNAVNTTLIENLKASKVSNKNTEIVFGYIGTITEYEGLEFLVETFQELYDNGYKYHLIIYGRGVNELSVVAQINKRKDIENIKFMGAIKPSNVFKAFENIDVIVNPRLDTPLTNSVTPLKPLEAMAYEKIFIGSDVGGIKEIVGDNNGFLFKAEQKEDLKKVIKHVTSLSYHEKKEKTDQSLKYVKAEKSWIQNAVKYKSVYDKLIVA